jgi:hypothetical protein
MVTSCNEIVSESRQDDPSLLHYTHIRNRRDRRSDSPWIKAQASASSGDLSTGKIAQACELALFERFFRFSLGPSGGTQEW